MLKIKLVYFTYFMQIFVLGYCHYMIVFVWSKNIFDFCFCLYVRQISWVCAANEPPKNFTELCITTPCKEPALVLVLLWVPPGRKWGISGKFQLRFSLLKGWRLMTRFLGERQVRRGYVWTPTQTILKTLKVHSLAHLREALPAFTNKLKIPTAEANIQRYPDGNLVMEKFVNFLTSTKSGFLRRIN